MPDHRCLTVHGEVQEEVGAVVRAHLDARAGLARLQGAADPGVVGDRKADALPCGDLQGVPHPRRGVRVVGVDVQVGREEAGA